jgi:iron complex outermembrane recepter protein
VDAMIKSESTQTFELGLKSLLAERRLRLNVALFDTHVRNFQDTVFTGSVAGFITENLPVSSKGVELETAWQAAPHLRLMLGATYADARERLTTQDFALVPDIACQPCRPAQSPAWTGNADIDYVHTLYKTWNWHVSVHWRYRDAMFNQRGDAFPSGVYDPIDAVLELVRSDGARSIGLSGSNLNNSLSEDFASPSVAPTFAGLASPAPLRALWITARLRM